MMFNDDTFTTTTTTTTTTLLFCTEDDGDTVVGWKQIAPKIARANSLPKPKAKDPRLLLPYYSYIHTRLQ